METDIDMMPAGPGLDALVAEKVMGWHLSEPKDGRGSVWLDEKGESVRWQPRAKLPYDWDLPYFQPSSDIAAAWEVVEDLSSSWKTSIYNLGRSWVCGFYPVFGNQKGPAEATSESAEISICRAALKAVKG